VLRGLGLVTIFWDANFLGAQTLFDEAGRILDKSYVCCPDKFLGKLTSVRVRVSDVTRLYTRDKNNAEWLRRAIDVEVVPESWCGYFESQLEKLTGSSRRDQANAAS
jgi:hypothetical protein